MIQYPRAIRNFNAFIDGVSYAGRASEAKLPELKIQVANHRGGGMDGPVPLDMGVEGMKAEATLMEWPPELIKMFGTRQRMTLRPIERGQEDFSSEAYVSTIGGLWTITNFADLKAGADVPMKLTIEADYFRMVKAGETLFEIDLLAGKRIIGGVDQLAGHRAAMGF